MKKKSMLIIAIILMSIGFASISTTLIINGNANVKDNEDDYSIVFTKASLDNIDVYDEVVSQDKKNITFTSKNLKELNDTSILNYVITNNSANYDAEVKVNCGVKENTEAKYTSIKNELKNNTTVIKAKESARGVLTITLDKTSTEEITEEYTCTLEFNAVERDTLGTDLPDPVSFATDSWETIRRAVQSGNTSKYNVGDTKKITIASHTNDCSTSNGKYGADLVCNSSVEPEKKVTIRIANMSECTTQVSQTACGFVVEFVDIIENHNYDKTDIDSWKNSELRAYINGTLYNSLPNELKNVIVSTQVVSSKLSNESAQTEDKLYLLTRNEIIGESSFGEYLTEETKQLDYYKNLGVTSSDSTEAIKQYNGSDSSWWLRTAGLRNGYFNFVGLTGSCTDGSYGYASILGISPAFRID